MLQDMGTQGPTINNHAFMQKYWFQSLTWVRDLHHFQFILDPARKCSCIETYRTHFWDYSLNVSFEKILKKSVEEIVRRTSRGWLKLCCTGNVDSNKNVKIILWHDFAIIERRGTLSSARSRGSRRSPRGCHSSLAWVAPLRELPASDPAELKPLRTK